MTNKTSSGAERNRESTEPESQKAVSFFFRRVSQKLFEDQCKMPLYHDKTVMTDSHNIQSLLRCFKSSTQELWVHLSHHFFTCISVCKPLSNDNQSSRSLNHFYYHPYLVPCDLED